MWSGPNFYLGLKKQPNPEVANIRYPLWNILHRKVLKSELNIISCSQSGWSWDCRATVGCQFRIQNPNSSIAGQRCFLRFRSTAPDPPEGTNASQPAETARWGCCPRTGSGERSSEICAPKWRGHPTIPRLKSVLSSGWSGLTFV